MKQKIKLLFYWLAKYTGLFFLSKLVTRKGLRILCYHGAWIGNAHYGNFLFISPKKFAERMNWLKQAKYPVLSLDTAVVALGNNALPDCATVITIDDGWYGTYREMLPILKSHTFPVTIYLTTEYAEAQLPVFNVLIEYLINTHYNDTLSLEALGISSQKKSFNLKLKQDCVEAVRIIGDFADNLNIQSRSEICRKICEQFGVNYQDILDKRIFHLMSIEEAAAAARNGVDFQLHTHRHLFDLENSEKMQDEIIQNKEILMKLIGKNPIHFCYPSGLHSEKAWPVLDKLAIASATTTQQGIIFRSTPRWAMPRLLDGQNLHNLEFEAELCGFCEILRFLKKIKFPMPKPI